MPRRWLFRVGASRTATMIRGAAVEAQEPISCSPGLALHAKEPVVPQVNDQVVRVTFTEGKQHGEVPVDQRSQNSGFRGVAFEGGGHESTLVAVADRTYVRLTSKRISWPAKRP